MVLESERPASVVLLKGSGNRGDMPVGCCTLSSHCLEARFDRVSGEELLTAIDAVEPTFFIRVVPALDDACVVAASVVAEGDTLVKLEFGL